MLPTGETVGPAEWIIDDTCPVLSIFLVLFYVIVFISFVTLLNKLELLGRDGKETIPPFGSIESNTQIELFCETKIE